MGMSNELFDVVAKGVESVCNIHRGLVSFCRKEFNLDGLVQPVGGDGNILFCIKPHGLIHRLVGLNPGRLRQSSGCFQPVLFKFWDQLRCSAVGAELWGEHYFLHGKLPDQLSTTVPLSIHEDAGPIGKKNSVCVISVSSLLTTGVELDTKFVCAAHIKRSGVDGMTATDDNG